MLEYRNGGRLVQDVSELPRLPDNIENLFLDFETTSKNPKLDSLDPWNDCFAAGIAITWDDVPGSWYIPIAHKDPRQNLPRDPVVRWLGESLGRSKRWVNHHVKYDSHVAYNDLGLDFRGERVCTVVRSKIMDSDRQFRGGYGLDALSDSWLHENIDQYGELLKPYLVKNKDYGAVPADICGEYGCQDPITNRRLYKYLLSNMPEESAPVVETETKLTSVLVRMERRGLLVKPEELLIEKLAALTEMVQIEERLHKLVGYPFIPTSNPDCFDVLCNRYGLPVLSWTDPNEETGRAGNPSFDADTLEMYKHRIDAPTEVVSLMIRYRKLSTFKSLFLETFITQAKHLGNGFAIMHPDHNQCVRTGRMSVKKPNTQQQDKRSKKLFHPGPGKSFLSSDACVPAGTLIPTPFGDKPIEEVCQHLLPVLSYTADGDLKFCEVSRGGQIGYGPIYQITFDDGSTFECTAEHGFELHAGGRVNCDQLVEGTRLKHVRDATLAVFAPTEYPAWYVNGFQRAKHRLAAQWLAGDELIDPEQSHVHHIDEDKSNWHIDNLEIKDRFTHISDHAKANYLKQDHAYRVAKLREAMATCIKSGERNSNFKGGKLVIRCQECGEPMECWPSQQKKFCSQECRSNGISARLKDAWANNDMGGLKLKDLSPRSCEHCGETFTPKRPEQKTCSLNCTVKLRHLTNSTFEPVAATCVVCQAAYCKKHETHECCSSRCANKLRHRRKILNDQNYKVVSAQHVRDDFFYSITVPETGKYVTTNGLVNHQSQVEFRVIIHAIKDEDVIRMYNENPDVDFHQKVADMCPGLVRRPAKTINFSVAFGQGKRSTVEALSVDEDVAGSIKAAVKELVARGELHPDGEEAAFKSLARQRGESLYDTYHETFPGIRRTAKQAMNAALARGYIKNIRGRRRYLPKEHAHKGFNSFVQSSAADLVKERMVALDDMYEATHIPELGLLTQVHDEVLSSGPSEVFEDPRFARDVVACLEDVHVLRVPLRFKYGVSKDHWYGAASVDASISLDDIKKAEGLSWLRR